MKNLFKRKKNYYYRIVVYREFKIYFNNLDLYDNSLRQEIKALSKILLKNNIDTTFDIKEYKIQFLGTRDRKFLPLIMFTKF